MEHFLTRIDIQVQFSFCRFAFLRFWKKKTIEHFYDIDADLFVERRGTYRKHNLSLFLKLKLRA